MGLKLNGPFCNKRLSLICRSTTVPVIDQRAVIHHEFLIQFNRHPVTDHFYIKLVPFTKWFIGMNQRISPWDTRGAIIPQPPRPFGSTIFPFPPFLGGVPYLNLRDAPQVNAAVRFGDGFVIKPKFKVGKKIVRWLKIILSRH